VTPVVEDTAHETSQDGSRDTSVPPETDSRDDRPQATSEPRGSRLRAVTVLAVIAVVAVVLDIVSKQLAMTHLREGDPARIVPGVLYFSLTRNSGAAFSMGTSITWVFPTIAIAVIVAIVYLTRRLRSVAWAVSLGLVLAGAIGNLIDRLFRAPGPFRGAVVDFISLFNGTGHGFAIFNVADSCLTIGVILAVLLELAGRHRDGSRART
jgi:signal peptidase II